MSDRRGFLRGLATLPLIGGSVALIGSPTQAAVPVTPELLQSYASWLFFERRMVCFELANHDLPLARTFESYVGGGNSHVPGAQWHFQWATPGKRGPAGWADAPQPSTRAAVVLSAVGCPLVGEADDDQ